MKIPTITKKLLQETNHSSWKKALVTIFLIIYFLLFTVYYSSSFEPGLRTDVEKTVGKISNIKNNSFLIQNPQPITLHQIGRNQYPESRSLVKYFYEFEFNKSQYKNSFNPKLCFLSSCSQAKKIELLENDQVTVYFDPQNANKNWLFIPPLYTNLEIVFAIGILSFVIAVLLSYLGSRKKV